MKKLLQYSILAIHIFTASITLSTEPTKLFIGSVQFPTTLDCDLCLYYKGEKITPETTLNDNKVQFSFLESQYAQELFILISENISCQTQDNNTVQSLTITSSPYKCYKLQATRSYEESETACFSWNISEYELEEKTIPDNTLIFLFDPALVQELTAHSWKTNNTLRVIPTILIDQSVAPETLKRAMITARLSAIDIDTVHKKTTNKNTQSQSAQALLTLIH